MRFSFPQLDRAVESWMRRFGVSMLQLAIGVTYLWFGALILFSRSPALQVIHAALPHLPFLWLDTVLGIWEVAIGVAILLPFVELPKPLENFCIRAALLLLFGEILAILLVAFLSPLRFFAPAFPALSVLGDFLVRRFVTVAAALVIAGHIRHEDEISEEHAS
jgi:hypothetical protein